jgi:hypothetical protein
MNDWRSIVSRGFRSRTSFRIAIAPKHRAFDAIVLQPAVERTWRQVRGAPDK